MLVSIIVITFNSSRFVLETLESAYRQTYQDLELIVSDDCSTDDTFPVCQQWVEAHKSRFVRTLCTQMPHNGGVTNNCNNALKYAQGEWIKYIAGDDILKDNCIERYIANIKPNIFLYSCIVEHLNQSTGEIHQYRTKLPNKKGAAQTRIMLRFLYWVDGSSLFFERSRLTRLGGFDIRYPMLEDWPVIMKFLTNRLNIKTINEPLVQWRKHNNSITQSNSKSHLICSKNADDCTSYYQQHYYWRYGLFLHQYNYWLLCWITKHYQKGYFYRILGYIFRCFDFVHFYRKSKPCPNRELEQLS